MESGIYKILNIVTNEFYIGSSSNLKNRKRTHFYLLNYNKHYNQHIQNAFNKHGKENFNFIILENCERDKLKNREQFYIDDLLPKYNKSMKADSYTDIILSNNALKKVSLSKKDKTLSAVCISRMKDTWKTTRNSHPLSKLNDEKVKELINNFNNGEDVNNLAIKYSILRNTVLGVLAGRSWKDFNYLVDQSKWNNIKRKKHALCK